MAPGGLFALALAEEVDLSAAVGAGDVAHVLHEADDGNVHLLGHLHGLFHDHGDEVLRGGDNDDAVERDGLEDAQRHIARAGGHIDEEVVDIPDHVRPELLDNAADDGAAPDDGIGLVLEQQVDGHQLHTCAAGAGIKPCLRAGGLVVHAEGLGDRGTRDIGCGALRRDCGVARSAQLSPQVEQLWVHSLIVCMISFAGWILQQCIPAAGVSQPRAA